MNKLLLISFILCVAIAQPSRISCPTTSFSLVKGIAMSDMTCTGNNLSLTPELPDGLYFENKKLYGTPVRGQVNTEYYVTDGSNIVKIYIGIYDVPSTIDYGFLSQSIPVGVVMDALPMRSNTIFSTVTIQPSLPNGLSINNVTGTISGIPSSSSASTVYTVTATNTFGSAQGTLSLSFVESSSLTTPGFSGCYYAQTLGCQLHTIDWYLQNNADKCQLETKFEFSDHYSADDDSHSWSGLDERFLDYFTTIFTGYINIFTDGEYTFSITSDDGAILYIDGSVVVNNDGCSPNGATTKTGKVTITAGKHLLQILYMQHGGTAPKLTVQYSATALSIPLTTLDTAQMVYGGRGPSFLTYPSIIGAVNSRISNTYPTLGSGYVSQYTVTPSLPTGLTLDATTGLISGIPTTASSATYTITATGPTGSASTTLSILVHTSLLPGIVGSYYKVTSNNMCTLQYFSLGIISKEVERIDTTIDHEESDGTVWEGLPITFASKFFVVYQGYLYIQAIGSYSFKLVNMDGARVYFDNSLVMRSWGCMTELNSTTYEQTFDTVGYHMLYVEFFATTTHFGLQLQWLPPNSVYYSIIPASNLFHVPSAQFTYSTQIAHYYKEVTIQQNNPIFFATSYSGSYTITPALPQGLSFNTNSGVITGAPTEEIDKRDFYISTSGAPSLTTKVIIQVSYIAPPVNLTLTSGTTTVTSATISVTDTINYSISYANLVTSLTISPDLPEGLTLSTRNRRISGTPKAALTTTVFTITARNDGGSAEYQFSLTITGCQYGYSFVITTLPGYQGSIAIKQAESVVEEFTNIRNAATYSVCIPLVSYTIVAQCTSRTSTCYYSLARSDGINWFTITVPANNAHTQAFDPIITAAPVLSLSANIITGSAGTSVSSLTISVTNPYTTLTFSPALPSYLRYDSSTHIVSGTFPENGVYSYIISTSNEKGTVSQAVTYNIGVCDNGKVILSFSRASAAKGDYFKVSLDGIILVEQSWSTSANSYSYKTCAAQGTYTVVYGASSTNGWAVYSQLKVVKGDDDLLGSFMLNSGESEMTKYFTLQYTISRNSQLYYYNQGGAPQNGWNNLQFSAASWPQGTKDSWKTFVQTTAYFRSEFTVDSVKKYPIVQYEIYVRDGYIMYMNGVEVMRKNMPSNPNINAQTSATTSYGDLLYRKGSIASSFLNDGQNVIAVEVHKYSRGNNTLDFDMAVELLEGTCILRSVFGLAKDSEHYQNRQNTPAMAFDERTMTTWRESGLPSFIQYSWYYDRSEFINKVVMTSSTQFNRRHPRAFTISGSEDGTSFTPLLTVNNDNLFTSALQDVNLWLTEHKKSYNLYRIDITESNDDSNYSELSGLAFYSCNVNYCKNDGTWYSVSANEKATISCPSGYVGSYSRACKENGYDEPIWEEADFSTCHSLTATGDVAYIDFNLISINATITNYASTVKPQIITTLRNNLGISGDNIYIFNDNDCTYNDVDRMCSYVRIVSDTTNGPTVFSSIMSMKSNFRTLVYQGASRFFPSNLNFEYQDTPVLRTASNTNMTIIIVVCSIIGVLLVLGLAFFLVKRFGGSSKHSKHNNIKPRSKSNGNMIRKESKKSPTTKADKEAKSRRDSAIKIEKKNQAKGLI